jgi:hypothetical protein
MNRLADFFFKDQAVRWKVYGLSIAAAFVYALVNLLALRREEQRVGIESVVVLLALISISIGVYVARVKVFAEAQEPTSKRFGLRLAWAGVLAAAFVGYSYIKGIPKMQAAIIDLRLERLTTPLPTVYAAFRPPDQLVQTRVQTINSIVETSSRNQIPVDPALLTKARTQLSNELRAPAVSFQTKQAAWAAAIDLQALAFMRLAEIGRMTTLDPREILRGPTYFINSVVSIDGKAIYTKGDHSVFNVGTGGQFVIHQSDVMFDSIDFVSSSPQELLVVDDRSDVLVRDSVITNVSQDLDRVTWSDVRFESSTILYRGGPLRLRNVVFRDCDLTSLAAGLSVALKSPESVAAIINSVARPVTFVYEP